MGRVLKGVFEVLIMVALAIIAFVVSFASPEKKEEFIRKQNKNLDSLEKDTHNKYSKGDISDMEFATKLNHVEKNRETLNRMDNKSK